MNEQEMLRQLKESAEKIPVPEELKPDEIEKRLEQTQNQKGKKKGKIMKISRLATAAALLLVCGIGVYAAIGSRIATKEESVTDMAVSQEESAGEITEENAEQPVRIKTLGQMYTLASSQQEIQEKLAENRTIYRDPGEMNGMEDSVEYSTNGIAEQELIADESAQGEAAADDYSTTNLQTEGVDEGDIMKTDGKYIYRILSSENRLVITDISGEEPVDVADFCPDGIKAEDILKELYVADNRLVLLAQRRDTSLTGEVSDPVTNLAQADVYDFDTDQETVMVTFDISDPAAPVEMGTYRQDGYYRTSRRIGDIVYLFTEQYNLNSETPLPEIQGEEVSCSDVYLGEACDTAMVMSSVDLSDPEQKKDDLMLLDSGAQIYVGNSAAYVYKDGYREGSYTDIAAFTLKNGIIIPVNAHSVPGQVMDTFAVSEKEGFLRVLTTDWNWENDGDPVNALYVLDENMELCGSLKGIAPGEQIYSARFLGDMGYFVTYRNMDPLFSVDLSDPENPKLVGELSVTGFSDYLHVWDADHLLGIGYETDPDTGDIQGLKLSMFNISDPTQVYEEGKCVLKDVDSSPALYDYKSVLVSKDKNVIGLMLVSYDGREKDVYTIFSYENGTFSPRQEAELANGGQSQMLWDYICQSCRSLYVGNRVYVMDGPDLIVLDITE